MKLMKILLLAVFASVAPSVIASQPEDKLNLLIIMTDQQRFDALSAAGNTILKTPNIDRIANEGVLFENAYTPVPVCGPTRTSILTGQSIDTTGISTNKNIYDPKLYKGGPSFDMVLSKAGYKTSYYGKWHSPIALAQHYENEKDYRVTATSGNTGLGVGMSTQYSNFLKAAGYTRFNPKDNRGLPKGQLVDTLSRIPYEVNITDSRYGLSHVQADKKGAPTQGYIHGTLQVNAAKTITAMEAGGVLGAIDRFKDEPFSLTVSFHFPHPPFTPAEPYASLYDADKMPLPANFTEVMNNSPYAKSNRREKSTEYRDPAKVREFMATYYGLITDVDIWVGKILDKLDEHNLTEKTLIVFVSDHGEMLGSHGMSSKNIFYEESVHVPFLMRLPGAIAAGTRIKSPVSSRDIFPTVLDYLGQPSQANLNSQSLRGVIEGKETRDFVVSEWQSTPAVPTYMIRKDDWKLLISNIPDAKSIDALYNLKTDPHEMNNLLHKGMEKSDALVAAELKSKLISWLEEAGSPAASGVKNRKLPKSL